MLKQTIQTQRKTTNTKFVPQTSSIAAGGKSVATSQLPPDTCGHFVAGYALDFAALPFSKTSLCFINPCVVYLVERLTTQAAHQTLGQALALLSGERHESGFQRRIEFRHGSHSDQQTIIAIRKINDPR